MGSQVQSGEVGGYYVDLRFKAEAPSWPPPWLAAREHQLHVATAQWGLGCFERYLMGEGEQWLQAARGAAEYLVADQVRGGPRDGAWVHMTPMRHSYVLEPSWISAMAQGEVASLLVRLHSVLGEEEFAEAAVRGLKPLRLPRAAGGALAMLDGGPFFEEYPTTPPSFVLNGGIFALWGAYDVGLALGDEQAKADYAPSPRSWRGILNAGMTTFSQLVAGDCRAKPMAVTFDDGYVSVYENAMPILKELGLPGTIFMPTALIGNEPIAAWPALEHWPETRVGRRAAAGLGPAARDAGAGMGGGVAHLHARPPPDPE